MKLKEKILVKAVDLFNERGISSTSPNQIAAALDISPGNLTYHYKTKAILVKEVYEKMHTDSEDFIKLEGYLTLDDFRKIMVTFQDFMRKHRFFFQDLFFILHHYPEVHTLYEASNALDALASNKDFLIHNVWRSLEF